VFRKPTANHPPLILRAGLLAALGVLYLATRQHIFTIDSLYYLWDVEFAPGARLLHPHHLVLEPLLRGWWRLWEWFAWRDRAVVPLQLLNVAVTLTSLALALRLFAILARDRTAALVWWLLLAFSYLVWHHATQTEGVPLFALGGTANLLWAACLPGRGRTAALTPRTAAALAATLAAGVLVHQSLVLWAPPLVWMLGREAPRGARWRYGTGTLAAAGGAVLAGYLLAGAWATGSVAPADLWRWFTGYSQEFAGRCGSLRLLVSADVPRGLASALLSGTPLKTYAYGGHALDLAAVGRLLPYAALALLVLGALVRLPGEFLGRDDPGRRALVNVTVLVVVGSLFAGWWEPSNRKFWAPVVPGILALAAVGWTAWRRRRPRRTLVVTVLVVAVAAAFNLGGGILPRHRLHDARQPLLLFLARSVRPADTVVLAEDRVWQCAIYFRPGQTVHGIPGPRSDRDDPEHTVLRTAVADARRALLAGATLYVDAREWPGLREALARDLGDLPAPVEVLRFGDAELHGDEQVLLALRLDAG